MFEQRAASESLDQLCMRGQMYRFRFKLLQCTIRIEGPACLTEVINTVKTFHGQLHAVSSEDPDSPSDPSWSSWASATEGGIWATAAP